MGIVAGALFVAADLFGFDAVGAIGFLAVAADFPTSAHQTGEPVPAWRSLCAHDASIAVSEGKGKKVLRGRRLIWGFWGLLVRS